MKLSRTTAIFAVKNMEQISTSILRPTIAERISSYLIAFLNAFLSGEALFDTLTGNRFPGADSTRFLFGLWFFGVFIFSIYSFTKPSWKKFAALVFVLLLEVGFFFYSLMGAIT